MKEIQKVDTILSQFFESPINSKDLRYNVLFEDWTSILSNEKLSLHCVLKEIEHDKLTVIFDHPGWIQIFKMSEKDILNRVNGYAKEFQFKRFQYILEEVHLDENKQVDQSNVYSSKNLNKRVEIDDNLDSKDIKSAFNGLKILFSESRKS